MEKEYEKELEPFLEVVRKTGLVQRKVNGRCWFLPFIDLLDPTKANCDVCLMVSIGYDLSVKINAYECDFTLGYLTSRFNSSYTIDDTESMKRLEKFVNGEIEKCKGEMKRRLISDIEMEAGEPFA